MTNLLEQKYVARDEYLNFLKRNRDKHIIKVVSGVRRSGKSTLFLLFRDYLKKTGVKDNQIINLNFEDMDFEDLLDPEKLYSYIKKSFCLIK